MKNNKHFIEKKKILFLIFMWICWFVPYFSLDIQSYPQEKLKEGLLLVVVMTIPTICCCLIKNNILKMSLFLLSLIGVALIFEINVALAFFSPIFLILIYKISGAESKKDLYGKITKVLLCLALVSSIISIVLNFESFAEKIDVLKKSITLGSLFIIAFAVSLRCPYIKKSKKNVKMLYGFVFFVVTIGIVASLTTFEYMLNISIMFFPWLLFVSVLIFEEDKILESSAEMIKDKVNAFLGIQNKKRFK